MATGQTRRKPVRKAVYGKTKAEVLDKLHELREKRKQNAPQPSGDTLKNQIEWWLDCTVKAKVAPATLTLYRQRVNDYIIPHLGGCPLHELTTRNIEEFLQSLGGRSADLRRKLGE